MQFASRLVERATAVCSFIAATALAFTSLIISDDNDIAAGVCMVIAQFLLLTASIFGIDYKLNSIGHARPHSETKANGTTSRHPQ